VLLVDMPIPSWHAHGAALAADYAEQLQALLPRLTSLPGVSALQMSEERSDDDFSDEVHPKPRVSARWASRLAAALPRDLAEASESNSTGKGEHG
jgi:hypothetical protein